MFGKERGINIKITSRHSLEELKRFQRELELPDLESAVYLALDVLNWIASQKKAGEEVGSYNRETQMFKVLSNKILDKFRINSEKIIHIPQNRS